MATHKPSAPAPKSISQSKAPAQPSASKKTDPRAALAVTAVEMGTRQHEISVSEFFPKNRHLLGFDSPRKALLTCVKGAVKSALDACEEAGILPEVTVSWRSWRPDLQLCSPRVRRSATGSLSRTTAPGSFVSRFPEFLRSSCTAPSSIASVWVPFTSESKEAIAEYDEIHKEIVLAPRECGRLLGLFLRRRERAASEYRRRYNCMLLTGNG